MEGCKEMLTSIVKRDGRKVPFELDKITVAVYKAAQAIGGKDHQMAEDIANKVCTYIEDELGITEPTVEQIQDAVEKCLIEDGHAQTAKAFILHRQSVHTLPRRAHPRAPDEFAPDESV